MAHVFSTSQVGTQKIYDSGCGRPVVLGVDGQARKVLEEAQGGIFVEPEDVDGLVEAIFRLYRDPDLRESLGMNGRSYILTHLSREQTAKDSIALLEKISSSTS